MHLALYSDMLTMVEWCGSIRTPNSAPLSFSKIFHNARGQALEFLMYSTTVYATVDGTICILSPSIDASSVHLLS